MTNFCITLRIDSTIGDHNEILELYHEALEISKRIGVNVEFITRGCQFFCGPSNTAEDIDEAFSDFLKGATVVKA